MIVSERQEVSSIDRIIWLRPASLARAGLAFRDTASA
jgi:hypothetical protein